MKTKPLSLKFKLVGTGAVIVGMFLCCFILVIGIAFDQYPGVSLVCLPRIYTDTPKANFIWFDASVISCHSSPDAPHQVTTWYSNQGWSFYAGHEPEVIHVTTRMGKEFHLGFGPVSVDIYRFALIRPLAQNGSYITLINSVRIFIFLP